MRRARNYGALIFLFGSVAWILFRAGQFFFSPTHNPGTDIFNIRPEQPESLTREQDSDDFDSESTLPQSESPAEGAPEAVGDPSQYAQTRGSQELGSNSGRPPSSPATSPRDNNFYEHPLEGAIEELSEQLTGEAVRFPSQGRNLLITLTIDRPGRCTGGDYTAIRQDLEANPDMRLMLTVDQRFSESSSTPKLLGHLELEGDSDQLRTLALSVEDELRILGLYICASSDGQRRCDQWVTSIGKILQEHQTRRLHVEAGKTPPDIPRRRTYFYAPMIIKGTDAIILSPEDMEVDLGALLRRQWPELSAKRLERLRRALEKMRADMGILQSETMQFDSTSQNLIITLPDYDHTSCQN